MKPKRYMLFVGDEYYASGGFDDLIGSYDTKHEANAALRDEPIDSSGSWAQIVDRDTGRIIRFKARGPQAKDRSEAVWHVDPQPRQWGTDRGGRERQQPF